MRNSIETSPRIPLEDLLTEYELHEDRQHIFVEGLCDQIVIRWFIDDQLQQKVDIYKIDDIDISEEILIRHSLHSSNRSRLIALSRELYARFSKSSPKVACIIDADFDYVLGRSESNPFLYYTDGASIESYCYSDENVDHVLRMALGCFENPPRNVRSKIHSVLVDLFSIRATNEELRLGLCWLPFERRCRVLSDGSLLFEADKFIRDYLAKGGLSKEFARFMDCFERIRSSSGHDERQFIHGHDFIETLALYCQKSLPWSPGKANRSRIMEGYMRLTLNRSDLVKEGLFNRIISEFA